MKYYHNPRCTKSRQGLVFLKEKGVEPEVVEYLKSPLTAADLKSVLAKLKMTPAELMRKKEADYKEHVAGKNLSDEALIQAMIDFPKLMERPILVNEKGAAIGRPAENFEQII